MSSEEYLTKLKELYELAVSQEDTKLAFDILAEMKNTEEQPYDP